MGVIAPVDQVMAESKAREQKVNFEGVNLGDQDRDVENAVEHSGIVDKPLEILHNEHEHGQGNPESHNDDPANSQGMLHLKANSVFGNVHPGVCLVLKKEGSVELFLMVSLVVLITL
jgi:hypothetical protein